MTKLVLTDTEWMRLIDGEREDSALPKCCANVSTLRDDLIFAAREGGQVHTFFNQVEQHLGWVFPSHGEPDPVIAKVLDQLGIVLPDYEQHEPQGIEV